MLRSSAFRVVAVLALLASAALARKAPRPPVLDDEDDAVEAAAPASEAAPEADAEADAAADAALAAALEIVEAPALELVIIGPGDDEYTLFGHAAMRVIDDADHPEAARVFNFGITDFENKSLAGDFIGGRVEFWGAAGGYAAMAAGWKREDRTVTRYPVLLPDGARRRLVARMERDVTPAHRRYIYDTFRENCGTRLRDYLDTYSGGGLRAAIGTTPGTRTFRDDARQAYSKRTALLMVTELMAGVDTDRPRSPWELTYRPEYMAERLAEVRLDAGPLLGTPTVEHQRQGPDPRDGMPNHGQVLWLAIAALLALLGWWLPDRGPRARAGVLLGVILFSTLIGTVMLWLGLSTSWAELQRNPAIFVFIPLDAALLWTAGRLMWTGETGPATVARLWLRGRLVVGLLLAALTPVVGALHGPLPPRLLGIALAFVALRALGRPQS
ncbi:MAG: DUF4105 domain-containing protein [Myxococcales bacterium]|nr:DUF4105 domain-containing protein [Myxococcales bacterium]MCB9546357.1 DUF4105 domain-containing protein [Myxococcales bacterium]